MIVTGPDNTPRGPNRLTGETLRGRRIGAGITLRRMAEVCGMTMYAMSRVEQGWGDLTWQERALFDGECERKHMEKHDAR